MKQRSIGYIGVIALAMAPIAMAQTPQPPPRPEQETSMQQRTTETRTVTGRVVAVDSDSLTVETSGGERMSFAVDRDLTQGPTPIAIGSQVRVEYRGEVELQLVSVNPVPAGSRPADEVDRLDDEDLDEEIAEEVDEMADDDDNGRAAGAQVDPDDGELPSTASPLPLLMITGLSLLGGGLGLSARLRR